MKHAFAWVGLALVGLYFQCVVTDESEDSEVSDTSSAKGETVDVQLAQPSKPEGSRSRLYSASLSRGNSRNYQDDCYVGFTTIRHGSVGPVTHLNPCWKKLCWYGQLHDREDGCYYQNQCYNLDSNFEVDCVTYRCSKTLTSTNGNTRSWRYNIQPVEQRCMDAAGRCRRTGEGGYSAYVQGRYYNNCECRSNGFTVCYYSH